MTSQSSTQPSLQEKFFKRTNQTWKGLKVGLKNGSLMKALEQIEKDLKRLKRLLDANEREVPVRQERRGRGNVKMWQAVRESAKNLYGALAVHWQCPPGHRHAASLRLETRSLTDLCDVFRFGLVMSLDHSQSQPQQLLWRQLEIEPQLANTPWLLGSVFDLNEIFLKDLKQQTLTTANLYIRRDFPLAGQGHAKPSTPLIENELVFALGVILIELAYKQPLANFKQPGDVDDQANDYPHTDLQVATRLVKDLKSMEGEKYADAAGNCVKGNFDVHNYSLDSAEFQEQFYTGVVLPLQELKASRD